MSNISGNSAVDKNRKSSQNQESQNNKHILESQLRRAEELTALGPQAPAAVDQAKQAQAAEQSNEIHTHDSFERQPFKPVQAPLVQPPEVGARVAQGKGDVAIPVDGRGAAVALHEHLNQLHKQGEDDRFQATAQALGVQDVKAFKAAFERGDGALQTFGHVDAQRLSFTDQDSNEVSPDKVSAFPRAQLLIRPGAATRSEHTLSDIALNPNLRQHDRQDHAPDASEVQLRRQTEPAVNKPADQNANVQA